MAASRDRAAIVAMRDQLADAVTAMRRVGTQPSRVVCSPADLGEVEPALARLRPRLLLFCSPSLRRGELEVS